MPPTFVSSSEPSAGDTSSATRERPRLGSPEAGRVPQLMSGPGTLGALGVAFFSLPWIAWSLTGEWVPEMLVFGLGAVIVALVAQNR